MAFLSEKGVVRLWSYITDKIDESKVIIDTSLTEEGQAADAKAVRDALNNFTEITSDEINEICSTNFQLAREVKL